MYNCIFLSIADHLSIIMTEEAPTTPVSAALKAVSNTQTPTNSPLRSKDVLLPLARVKTIMKSSPDVDNIGQESLFLVTKVNTSVGITAVTRIDISRQLSCSSCT